MPLTERKTFNIDNWHSDRAQGMARLHQLTPNAMLVNAQDVFPLDYQCQDYALYELPEVARVMAHPALSGIAVISVKDTEKGEVLLEHYGRDKDRNSINAHQSSSKTIGHLLLNRVLQSGNIQLDDLVEAYIPNIGSGFRGRTVNDVASMAVHHNVDETAAYEEVPEAMAMFNRDERVIGFQRNDDRETLCQFILDIQAAGEDGSNQWQGEALNYATINTSVLLQLLASASGVSAQQMVREVLHDIGGENTVYMGTDFEGMPVIGASLISSTIDFARYGRLLIKNKTRLKDDYLAAHTLGQFIPAELTSIPSRYYKSAILNEYGIGHTGWAGQLIWADPESEVIVAINSAVASKLPVPYDHFEKLFQACYAVINHSRSGLNN